MAECEECFGSGEEITTGENCPECNGTGEDYDENDWS